LSLDQVQSIYEHTLKLQLIYTYSLGVSEDNKLSAEPLRRRWNPV